MKANIIKRPASTRGRFNRGWLNAKYTFSFNRYYDANYMGFSDLKVINDDRIAPFGGFETHPHRDMEIFTYIMKGKMQHKDSIDGKEGYIETGEFQYMSAGTGVFHSEKSVSSEETHLLQIWIEPDIKGVKPKYESRKKEDIEEMKKSSIITLASGSGMAGSIKINNKEAAVLLLKLEKDKTTEFNLKTNKSYYFQIAIGSCIIEDNYYTEGDGGAIAKTFIDQKLLFRGHSKTTEIIIFELRQI